MFLKVLNLSEQNGAHFISVTPPLTWYFKVPSSLMTMVIWYPGWGGIYWVNYTSFLLRGLGPSKTWYSQNSSNAHRWKKCLNSEIEVREVENSSNFIDFNEIPSVRAPYFSQYTQTRQCSAWIYQMSKVPEMSIRFWQIGGGVTTAFHDSGAMGFERMKLKEKITVWINPRKYSTCVAQTLASITKTKYWSNYVS